MEHREMLIEQAHFSERRAQLELPLQGPKTLQQQSQAQINIEQVREGLTAEQRKAPPYLSVVIPCFNEIDNLRAGVLEGMKSYLDKQAYTYHVTIVDDGSEDGSPDFIDQFTSDNVQFSLIRNPHLGKAGAVTTGVLQAEGKYILFTDMDQATPIDQIENLLPSCEQEIAIAMGSRASHREGSPLVRKVMSWGNTKLRKVLMDMDFADTQCGFKMFEAAAARDIFSQIHLLHDGFNPIQGAHVTPGFDVELLHIAQKSGYDIKEIPVLWHHVDSRRVNPLTDSLRGVRELLQIKKRAMQGKYDRKSSNEVTVISGD